MNSIGVNGLVSTSVAPTAEQAGGEGGRDPVADGAVADLVVVLQVAEELPAGQRRGVDRPAVVPPAEARPGAVVEEGAGEDLGQAAEAGGGEVGVVALALAGQQRVQRVVEVVAPLRGQAHAAGHPRGDHAGVVEVALGDQGQRPADGDRQLVDLLRHLLEHVRGPLVDQRVDGVEPQPVDVHVAQPHQRVVDDVAAHLVGVGAADRLIELPHVFAPPSAKTGKNSGR